MGNLAAGFPGVNTLFTLAQNEFDSGELSPTFDVLRKAKNVYSDIASGKDLTQLAWDVARITSYLTKIPALNVVKTLLDWNAAAKGEKNPLK
jgi:hypothetical protein